MKTNTKILTLLISFIAVFGNFQGRAQSAQIEICADASDFMIGFDTHILPAYMYTGTGQPAKYSLTFTTPTPVPNSWYPLPNLTNQNFTNTSSESRVIKVPLPNKVYPHHYSGYISLTNTENNCTYVLPINVDVLYPSSIMEQKWEDAIALLNQQNNGGYVFTGYQWYRNGQLMSGQTASYIYVAPNILTCGDKYSVELARNDGTKVKSCLFAVVCELNDDGILVPIIVPD